MTSPKIDPYQLFADKHDVDRSEVLMLIQFDPTHALHKELMEWVSDCKGETMTLANFKSLRKKVDEQSYEIKELQRELVQIRSMLHKSGEIYLKQMYAIAQDAY